ncbi:hypothetical protein CYLTODRAFT_434554 [Cylindrobasidium torrendii FP15055 ss-10]|uniref:Uncharacterized protein n=1 Tax=Cylindrobasidium torrendii FP15055 ss-10 TaxID=1314674 RepID=A0A0D7BRA9_9AGAR|nr:hypothetical protein CYLTODRAFT_434554 [Cylindrobasidium torrendii FP15055 ss-10]
MSETLPPPVYSQQDPATSSVLSPALEGPPDPQIAISPTVDSVNFQKGFLGADGERAAIEGELQIKGAEPGRWHRITMSLRTVEKAFDEEIELGKSDLTLFSCSLSSVSSLPTSILFAIPLMPDAPQSIRTAQSSLTHSLVVTLHPSDSVTRTISKTMVVHTRRYSAHGYTLPIAPETFSMSEPILVRVQVPRTTFMPGDAIPLYVTIPPPDRSIVVGQGLRLRNVRAEFIRIVTNSVSLDDSSTLATFKTILAHSGASCRFHSSRPLQMRFVLHQVSPTGSPTEAQAVLPPFEHDFTNSSDADSPSISQSTLLHNVTFCLEVHVSLVDTTRHTERIHTVTVPITVIPAPAPLPEVAAGIDNAYSKKHDRPPTKTNRYEEADYVPNYHEGEAGPSVPYGAPPPFEERDAPPPFSMSAAEASSSHSGLPTFLEAESHLMAPSEDEEDEHELGMASEIPGEGTLFGFSAAGQFDGHSEEGQRATTPPPTLEMASFDTDVTPLADIPSTTTLGLVFDQEESSHDPPPPPPPMDDPSDPPPTIDSDFRVHDTHTASTSPEPQLVIRPLSPAAAVASTDAAQTQGHAPPPYRVPSGEREEEHSNGGPPPYMG